MKIKTKLNISTLVVLTTSLLIGFTLYSGAVDFNAAIEEGQRSNDIAREVGGLRTITSDYLNQPTVTNKARWTLQYDSIRKLLVENFKNKKGQVILDNIRKNYEYLAILSAQNDLIEKNRILAKSDAILSNAFQLNTDSRNIILEGEVRNNVFILIATALIAIVVAVASFLVRRSLTEPISKLYESTKMIGQGDLDYKAEEGENDEMGELMRAFNAMTARLKIFYTCLEKEIKAGTKQLSLKVKALEISKKKMGNIMKSLEKTNSKDKAILESIGDGMMLTDKKGKVIFVNRAFEELFGWTSKEVKNKNIFEFIPIEESNGDKVNMKENPINVSLNSGKRFTDIHDYFYRTKNNKKLSLAITLSPILLKDKIVGGIGLFRDITKEKKVGRMKNEFLSFAAHQLRTPLGSMRWNLELLLEKKNELAPEITERLSQIHESDQRIIKLVNDLLDISSIDQGEWHDKPVLTDVSIITEAAIKENEVEAQQKNITISIKRLTATIPHIMVDPENFHEVMMNIFSNAIKYNRVGGKINITFEQKEKKLEITVTDTGIGIPQEDLHSVFSKFFRSKNVTVNETEGEGIGLFMVKSYVTRWGGKVWLESEENKYTTYYLEFNIP